MSVEAILLPVFAQVLLTFVLLGLMASRRYAAVQRKEVRRADVTLGQKVWPEKAQAAANAFSNQFELPVLFYALVALALATRTAGAFFLILSWVFVATRILHAIVYVTTNEVPKRFAAYVAGVAVLLTMWIAFAIRILFASPPA